VNGARSSYPNRGWWREVLEGTLSEDPGSSVPSLSSSGLAGSFPIRRQMSIFASKQQDDAGDIDQRGDLEISTR
jgi:hypothetical protein